jgi:phage baseplate assembly protein W
MPETPHFSLPFRFEIDSFGVAHAAVNEQDSLQDITDCVTAILSCPLGFRFDLPEFGLRDQTFGTPGADLDEIQHAITQWEPRADVLIEEDPSMLNQLIDTVRVRPNVITVLQSESEAQ